MSAGKRYPDEAGFPTDQHGPLGTESLGDSEPFSRVVSERREQPSSSAPDKPARVPELKAILLGPPGSGKSAFIAALQQSLIANPSNVVRRCAHKDTGAPPSNHASEAAPASEASAAMRAERFYVELAQPPRGVELVLYESRGNFASESQDDKSHDSIWIAQAQSAQLLLLCVDAGDGQRDYWRLAVERVARDLTWRKGDLGTDDSEVELGGILPKLNRGGKHCLPFKRVLFLLSRVDLLFERALKSQNSYGFLKLIAAQEPSQLARALDPVPQLCSLLGTSTVGKMLHVVQEDAEVAVAAVSSRGMSPILSHLHRKRRGRARCTAGLTEWRPLGVKEAVEFLVTGQCTAPVAPLSRSILRQNDFIQLL